LDFIVRVISLKEPIIMNMQEDSANESSEGYSEGQEDKFDYIYGVTVFSKNEITPTLDPDDDDWEERVLQAELRVDFTGL
jgi:hypothetical protein